MGGDESIMKVDAERFGCDFLLQDFKFMKNGNRYLMK